MFKKCGTYEPEISYLRMIYGGLTEKVWEAQDQNDDFQTDKENRFQGAQQGPDCHSMAYGRYSILGTAMR